MRLKNDNQLLNTQRKLADLEKLIREEEQLVKKPPAHELSLKTMRRFAEKLRAEIVEYEQAHQKA